MPDKKIPVRALTRGEVKALRKDGINLAFFEAAQADEIIDRVIDIVCTKEQVAELDAQENAVTLDLFEEICALSFPKDEEVKN